LTPPFSSPGLDPSSFFLFRSPHLSYTLYPPVLVGVGVSLPVIGDQPCPRKSASFYLSNPTFYFPLPLFFPPSDAFVSRRHRRSPWTRSALSRSGSPSPLFFSVLEPIFFFFTLSSWIMRSENCSNFPVVFFLDQAHPRSLLSALVSPGSRFDRKSRRCEAALSLSIFRRCFHG